MRKIIKHLAVISAIFLALGGFISCSNGSDDPEPMTFTVTVSEAENGTVKADKTSGVAAGDTVTLTVSPESGYELDTLTVKNDDAVVTVTDYKFKMPAGNVTVTATFKKTYTVTITEDIENGTVSADKTTATEGTEVTLTVTPEDGYELDTLTVENDDAVVTVTDYKFTMPAGDVTVTATFVVKTEPPAGTKYAVIIADNIQNGTVSAKYGDNAVTAETALDAGTEVTLTVTPSDGYEFDTLTYTTGNGNNVTVTDNKFEMPAADVTVNATFKLKQFTVTFNTDGGSSVESKTVDYDTTVTAPTDPTKEGYKLDGWYNGDTKFEFTTTIKDNLTLTAKWIQLVTSITITGDNLIEVGDENSDGTTLTLTVLPETAADKTVTWSSSNDKIATVENGVVKGVKAGSVTITATAADGSNVTGEFSITVCDKIISQASDLASLDADKYIALGENITLDSTLTISKSLTLDLNGHTITRGSYNNSNVVNKHIEIDNADVVFTLKDSSSEKKGKILSPAESSGYTVWVKQGTFNFESGTIEQVTYSYNSGNGGSYGVCIGASGNKVGTFNLKGGKILYTAKRMGAVKVEDYISDSTHSDSSKHSVFNMESGEIYAVSTEVPTNPDVVMNYGKDATGANEYYKVAVANFGETYIKGGKITGDLYCDPQSGLDNKDPIIKVTGGEIIGGILGTSSHGSNTYNTKDRDSMSIACTIEISGGNHKIYGIQTKEFHGTNYKRDLSCATIKFTGGTYDLSKCLVDVDDSKVEVGDAVSSSFSGIDGYILEDGKLHIFTMGYIKGTGNSTDYKLADSDYPEGSEANVNRTSDWINDTFWFKFSNVSNISGKYVWMKFVGSDNKAAAIDCGKDFVKAGNYYAGSFLNKGQWDYMAESMQKSNAWNANDNRDGNYGGDYTVYVYAFDGETNQTAPTAENITAFGNNATLIGSRSITVEAATYE